MAYCMTATAVPYDCDVVLRDGSTLHVRPIAPSDASGVLALYRRLSADSLYNRFAGRHTPDAIEAARLCEAHGDDAFALVGERRGELIAIVHYCRDHASPSRAEVAFTVADEFHGRGVATRMLERLSEVARAHGIETFDAYVLGSNHSMLQVLAGAGFELRTKVDHGFAEVTLSLAETPAYEERAAVRAQASASASMRGFFEPRTVAVVGVSRQRGQIGAEIFHNLTAGGFRGRVVPVNPHAGEIESVTAYPTVTNIPGEVDLAVVAVPAWCVERVVDDCLAKGVRAIVVISAGFGEMGDEGRAREAALVTKVRAAGVRMIGPNCLGVVNTDPAVRLNATFAPVCPPPGHIAFSSQSGALGLAILDYAQRLNLGISTFVSVGNKADVSSNDLLQYWAEDPRTEVILLYLESFGNPQTFSRLARRIGRRKPIVAVKAGRSRAGARAASSHTGALTASDTIVDALFRQSGVIRTETLEELFDVAAVLAHQPVPAGPRVAILTNAGGPGILAADACEALGLEPPPLALHTIDRLRAFLPPAASVANPIDMLATASADDYRRAIPLLLADPGVDSLLTIFIPPLVTNTADVAAAIAETTRGSRKPVLATFVGAQGAPDALAPVPCFAFPESAARALARAVAYGQWRVKPTGTIPVFRDVNADAARAIVDRAMETGGGWLPPLDAFALLAAYGIPMTPTFSAASETEAVEMARRAGFPVALKGVGPAILHKRDAHAVVLNLPEEASLREAYRGLTSRLGSTLSHVLVQPMAGEGTELFVGATLDSTFGHVVVCGSGGTLVEWLHDTVCRLHPLTDLAAHEMLSETRGVALLRGFRGAPRADEGAFEQLLLRVSALIGACPEILELDVNPVIVTATGACGIDVRVRVGSPPPRPPSRRVAY